MRIPVTSASARPVTVALVALSALYIVQLASPSATRYGLHVLSPDSVVDRRRARGASTRNALLPRGLPTARRRARHCRPRRSVGDRRAQPHISGAGDGVALGRPPSGPPARRDSDGDRVRAEPAVVHVGEVRRDAALGDRLLRARRVLPRTPHDRDGRKATRAAGGRHRARACRGHRPNRGRRTCAGGRARVPNTSFTCRGRDHDGRHRINRDRGGAALPR